MATDESVQSSPRVVRRRSAVSLIGWISLGAVGASLAACSAPAPTPTSAPKPTDTAAKPAAGATTAPVKGQITKIRLGMLVGIQTPPVLLMQKLKIWEKNLIDVQVIDQAGPDAIHTALRTGNIDLGGVGLHTIAAMRLQGGKVYNVFGQIMFWNDILVKKDSPLQTLSDLKGKTLGYYSGPSGGNVPMVWVALKSWYGIDYQKDLKNQYGAPPVISAALGKGEIDACLMLDPIATQMLESGEYRTLGNVSPDFQKNLGRVPTLVSIGATEEFAERNPQAVTAYIRSFVEAVGALKGNKELWQEVGTTLQIKTPQGIQMLQERTEPTYITTWNEQTIAEEKRIGLQLIEVSKELMTSWPDDAFTTKFIPR